jgi:putative nucleotidyltransferase with HDIG domain/PAS domain S-box-containing protein
MPVVNRADVRPPRGASGKNGVPGNTIETAGPEDSSTFRTAFDIVEEAIHAVDRNLVIIQANRSLLQLNTSLGFSTEVIGRPLKTVYPFLQKEVIDQYRRVFSTGSELLTTETNTFDGRSVVTRTRKIPVKMDGRVERVITIIRDSTDEQRFVEAMRFGTERLKNLLDATVSGLAALAEHRDPYTAGHQMRVTRLACAVAAEMGMERERIESIRVAATLHDIGKIHVPAEILNKPGRLSDLEMKLIRTHPEVAHEILRGIPFESPVAEIVLQHHEKMDGSGYPRGLGGGDLLVEARILTVADVVEAMAHNRPYRPPHGIGPALRAITEGRGTLFDPDASGACLDLFARGAFSFEV